MKRAAKIAAPVSCLLGILSCIAVCRPVLAQSDSTVVRIERLSQLREVEGKMLWTSPDGSRWAYATGRGSRTVMVVDGRDVGPYSGIAATPFRDLGTADLELNPTAASLVFQPIPFAEEPLTPPQCKFALLPRDVEFESRGGRFTINLTINGTDSGDCGWTVPVNRANAWLTISPRSGAGPAEITITAPPNPGPNARSATVTIADQTLAITQAPTPVCTFTLSPNAASFDADGGSVTLDIVASAGTCAWNVANVPNWLTVAPGSGVGAGRVTITAAANPGAAARSATGTIANRTLEVSQAAGAPPDPVANVRLLASAGTRSREIVQSLVELNTSPLSEQVLIPSASVQSLDFTPDGMAYGLWESLGTLVRIDPGERMVSRIGDIRSTTGSPMQPRSLAFSPDGKLFVTDSLRRLYIVDLNTAEAQPVGSTPIGALAIDFGPDGRLFAAGANLLEIDPETAETISTIGPLTLVTSSGASSRFSVTEIDFAKDGFIYGFASGGRDAFLYRIDPATAHAEVAGEFPRSSPVAIASGDWADQPLPALALAATRSGSNIVFSWPAAYGANLVIESTSDLASGVWSPYRVITPPAHNSDGQWSLTIPLPQAGSGDGQPIRGQPGSDTLPIRRGGGGRDGTRDETPQEASRFFRLRGG